MSQHKTMVVVLKGKSVEIDIEMVETVRWLNSFNSITTHHCCQGYVNERPYIKFTHDPRIVDELVTVMNVIHDLRSNGDLMMYSQVLATLDVDHGLIYTIRFYSRETFEMWKTLRKDVLGC